MAGLALHDTLGAALIGTILGACLYGLTTLQTYTYYNRNQQDSIVLKTLIAILWLSDSLHLAFISHTVYDYAVNNFGSVIALLRPTWSVLAQVIVTGFSDGIVRGIFCYRIWILSDKNVLLVIVLAVSSLLAFGCSIAFPIVGFQYTTFFEVEQESWILYLGLSTVVLSDLLMTATLCLLLSTRRSNIAMVNGVIRNLILYSINTCALTTLCSLAALVAYAASPRTFIYIAFYFLLPKLLLNSLLAALNARKSFRKKIGRGGVHLTPSSVMHSRDGTSTRDVDVDRRQISLYPMPLRSASVSDLKGSTPVCD